MNGLMTALLLFSAGDTAWTLHPARADWPAWSEAAVAAHGLQWQGAPLDTETQRLRVPVVGGQIIEFVRTDARTQDGVVSWAGRSAAGDRITLSAIGGQLAGRIDTREGVYEIAPTAGDPLLLTIDDQRFPPCAGAIDAQPGPRGFQRVAASPRSIDPPDRVDVLVLFTTAAAQTLGGAAQARVFAQQAVDSANAAYQNSALDLRFRLAGSEVIAYTETNPPNSSADLSWLRGNAEVAALRNRYSADMVGLITEPGSGCGVGYVMRNPGAGFAGSAFQVTRRSCAIGNLTYAHEHGHNLGLEHDPANGTAPASASFPYAFGHFVDGSYRTVMSYSSPCTQGCTRRPYFSNPEVIFSGAATGIAEERDNARVLAQTFPITADFRLDFIYANGF